MTVMLQAPHPLLETTTLLPSPEFSDSEALTSEMTDKRAMDGTLYTYVKTKNDRRKLLMQFTLTRLKGLELRAFLRAYYTSRILLTDHNDVVWLVNVTNNPFEFDSPSTYQSIQLEFEGTVV